MTKNANAHLIYPHQLFKTSYLPEDVQVVFVIEEPLYFGTDQQYPVLFHKQKLMLHRASMRRYVEEVLWPAGYEVVYVDFEQLRESGDIIQKLRGFARATFFDVVDDVLQRRLQAAAEGVPDAPPLVMLDTPNFYLKRSEATEHFAKNKQPHFDEFYQWQRERFNILIDEAYKPVGGSWMYEPESKKRLPEQASLPTFEVFGNVKFVDEARRYIEKHFAQNPGSADDFSWPTNHTEAEHWLTNFLAERLEHFSEYSEAIDGQAPWQFHSAISPALNIGLLNPQQVVEAAVRRNSKNEIPLSSLENFVRQVLGWREYMRGLYVTNGVAMRTAKSFGHKRKLTQDWYAATTGIPPLDDAIKKAIARGYLHGVERLKIVGSFMVLSHIDQNDIYQWCMEMMVDAYDWVVVPNVYALTDFAGDALVQPKLSLSSGDYILQMSHYQKGEWTDVWDGLYWGFVEEHEAEFAKNPHTKLIVQQLRRMSEDRRRIIGYRASDYLNTKTKEQ